MYYLLKKIFRSKQAQQSDVLSAFLRKRKDLVTHRVANYLSQKEQRLSVGMKKAILAAFCLTVSVYAGALIYRAFTATPENARFQFFQQPSITAPVLGRLPDSLRLRQMRQEILSRDSAFIHK